ncbi:hypothetical protein ALC62_11069, partial [Cyphomyrmex costatus]
GPVFVELTAPDSIRTLKNFCFSNGRIPTARDPIDRNPEMVDSGGGSNDRQEPADLSRLEAIRDTLSRKHVDDEKKRTRGRRDPTLRPYEEGHSRPGYAGGDHVSRTCIPDNEGMSFHCPPHETYVKMEV